MFHVIQKGRFRPDSGSSSIYLEVDNWNDYSFVTMFDLSLHDEQGVLQEIGAVKIGFVGQTTTQSTYGVLPATFPRLGEGYFSLGQSVEFYKKVASLSPSMKQMVLDGLIDIVSKPDMISRIEDEKVFGTSLLRMVSLSEVRGQFARVLQGFAELTSFSFSFSRQQTERMGGIEIPFDVVALSTPSTNVHAIIGRNGVGKTTLLNGMIGAVTNPGAGASFMERNYFGATEIDKDFFSSLVSVSFSAFDPFEPPAEQSDPAKGTCYFYVGLKGRGSGAHRSIDEIQKECARYLIGCFSNRVKSERWVRAIDKLGSDENFASMGLGRLKDAYDEVRQGIGLQSDSPDFRDAFFSYIRVFLERMSSGHAIVLLTTAFLVAKVEEKTLVLLDEPESHLHPPLLSAFIRALSDLLHDRNGVAIVATHSPVVLQEIPRSCVWKVTRSGLSMSTNRPDIETFGENLGLLTSEVFSLEVERSGFHALLAEDVKAGKEYDEVIAQYDGQLGLEGRAILRALIANRDVGELHASSD